MESTAVTPEREKELLAKRSLLVKEVDGMSQGLEGANARVAIYKQIRAIDKELHPPDDLYYMRPEIPLVDCKKGHLYRVHCRNFSHGVFNGVDGFIGIREKFGNRYLDTEFHYDTGAPHGTLDPREDLGPIPEHLVLRECIDEVQNEDLYAWLSERLVELNDGGA